MVIEEIQRWHDAIGFDEACLIFATAREATDRDTLAWAVTRSLTRWPRSSPEVALTAVLPAPGFVW